MAPFEEMSAIEKEELIVSLAALICADASVEISVSDKFYYLLVRRIILISLLRNLVTRLLLTGLLSSLLTAKVRTFLIALLLLVKTIFNF